MKHISVVGSNIMWSAEEGLPGDVSGLPVGIVYMFDPTNLTALPIKVTWESVIWLFQCNRTSHRYHNMDKTYFSLPFSLALLKLLPLSFCFS